MAEQGFAPPTSEWYHPSDEIVAAAAVPDYDAVYQAALDDPAAFWEERAETLDWYEKWDTALDDSNKPFYKWFTGGKTNMVLNALDRHVTTWRRNKIAFILGGRRRRQMHLFLPTAVAGGEPVRQCAARQRREERRPRHDLYGARARDRHRHAGLRQGGRAAQRGLRRFQRTGAVQPHRRCPEQGADRLRRRLAAWQDRAVERHGRRSAGTLAHRRDRHRGQAHRSRHQHGRRARSLVSRLDGGRQPGRRYRSHGCRRPRSSSSTPAARPANPKAFCIRTAATRSYTSTTLAWAFDIKEDDRWWCAADPGWITGHSYIVYAPLILGRDQHHLRRRADISRTRPLVADRGKVWRQHPLHGANRHPRLDALRRRLARETRPEQPALAGGRSANPSIPKPGAGITASSGRNAAPSSTPGGRRRRAVS